MVCTPDGSRPRGDETDERVPTGMQNGSARTDRPPRYVSRSRAVKPPQLHVPGGHGHNYHDEMLWYWDAVLGDHATVRMTDEIASRAREFIVADSIRR